MSLPCPPSYEDEEGFYFEQNSVYSINGFKNSPCWLKYIRAQYMKWLHMIVANSKSWQSEQVQSAKDQILAHESSSQKRRKRSRKRRNGRLNAVTKSAVTTPSVQLHSEMEWEKKKENPPYLCGVEQDVEERLCRTPGQYPPSFTSWDNISTRSDEFAPTVILSEVSSPVSSIAESMPVIIAASLLGVQETIKDAEGIIQEQHLVTAASLVEVETMLDNLGGGIVVSLVKVWEMIQKTKSNIEGLRLETAASFVEVEIMIQTANRIIEEQRLLIIEKKKELSLLRHRKELEAKVEALIKTQSQLLEEGIQQLGVRRRYGSE
ncbi:hypothetical protein BGX38DRAFT_1269766 [Terfezia claveryi]|nr:hypothetical protein BGX38DRAFT_1269766 [Terfezia claveryi]